MLRVGVDVGGTFTDIMLWDDEAGSVTTHKLPSTPADPARAMLTGLREITAEAGVTVADLDQLLHGTTVATNIVLERNGSEVGMLTTEGFRDIIYIGRHRRPYTFSIYQDLPWREPSLVLRRHRLSVRERVVAPSGEVLVPLDEKGVRAAARRLREAGVDAVTVCFLFSFLEPAHECRAAEIVREEMPEAYVCVSHEIVPLHREYERFSTTCLNAYIGPKTSRYLDRMKTAMAAEAPRTDVHLMASNGGIVTTDGAVARPVSLLMSGPAAGIVGGIFVGRLAGAENVITLDVGGTSADIGVAPGGRLRMKHLYDTAIGGYDVMLPMVDMDTIGAGGGSLARVDAGGLLRVGPQSAGADPGPACYARGGTEATATDAQVVLGRLRAESFLGGRMAIEPERAAEALERHLTGRLGVSLDEAAMGVVRILNHNMERAIELNSVRKGYDPRAFALVAFGGAGPLSACDVALELSIPRVIVPRHPGITSALGLLATDLKYEVARTVMVEAPDADPAEIERVYAELEAEGRARLEEDDVPPDRMLIRRVADCRYTGQAYELLVDVPAGAIDAATIASLEVAFHEQHEREFFWRYTDKPVQIVHLRVYALGLTPELEMDEIERGGAKPDSGALIGRFPVGFYVNGEATRIDTTFWSLPKLRAGNEIFGPAIVEQDDATAVVNPGLVARVDPYGNLIIGMSIANENE
ncbi:MAG: hydantoinase/oxoprolinase family protein [Actinobacteria bacterium]|nr:hydantoinase/oxoprolinase family protein [Actinomycetota bacterium]